MTEASIVDAFVGSAYSGDKHIMGSLIPWIRKKNLINGKDKNDIDAFTAATLKGHNCIVKMLLEESSLLLEANGNITTKNHLDHFLQSDCWDSLELFMNTVVLNIEGGDRVISYLIKLMHEDSLYKFIRLLQHVNPEHPNNKDFIIEVFYRGNNRFIISTMNFFRKHLNKIIRRESFPANAITAAIDKASFSCCALFRILQKDFLRAISKTKMITEDNSEHKNSLTIFLFQDLVSHSTSEELFLETLPFINPNFKDHAGASITMKILENPLLDMKVTINNMKLTRRLHRVKALIDKGTELSCKDNNGKSTLDHIRVRDYNKLTPQEHKASSDALSQVNYTPINDLLNEDLPDDLHLMMVIKIATAGTIEFDKKTIINCVQKNRWDLAYLLSTEEMQFSNQAA